MPSCARDELVQVGQNAQRQGVQGGFIAQCHSQRGVRAARHKLALKPDGTVWVFGRSDWGQIGTGGVASLVPVLCGLRLGQTGEALERENAEALRGRVVWPVSLGELVDARTQEVERLAQERREQRPGLGLGEGGLERVIAAAHVGEALRSQEWAQSQEIKLCDPQAAQEESFRARVGRGIEWAGHGGERSVLEALACRKWRWLISGR